MNNELIKLINEGKWVEAKDLLIQYKGTYGDKNYDDTFAILESSIYQHFECYEEALNCIRKGLRFNINNYELYFTMGNIYEALGEEERAYLCYENSIFLCISKEDKEYLSDYNDRFRRSASKLPNKIAIVIISYNNLELTKLCIDSIKEYNSPDAYELIVVDNKSDDDTVKWLKSQTDIKLILNNENKGFPAGCNQGIEAADKNSDIFLLNNDTVLFPNSIFSLRMGLYKNEKIGAVGSVSNKVSYYQQIIESFDKLEDYYNYALKNNIPDDFKYERRIKLVGFAALLKREALNKAGMLDERFTPGNFEDDDICLRLLKLNYQILLCKDSFIYHFGSKSFGKDLDKYQAILSVNRKKFLDKWHINLNYSGIIRHELIGMIKQDRMDNFNVLDVGCACGATLLRIKSDYPCADLYGIELNHAAADIARCSADILEGNVEELNFEYKENFFDYIMFGDILEHLKDPEALLVKMKRFLKNNGKIIASIPNIMHYSVIIPLLKGDFTYQEAGILDKTHLRFFTANEIARLFMRTGYSIINISANVNKPAGVQSEFLDKLCSINQVSDRFLFEIYQFYVYAEKK